MKSLKIFLFGFLITATLHQFMYLSCNKSDPVSSTNSNPDVTVDFQKIAEGAANVEKAFESGDYKKVELLLTDQAKAIYKDELPNLTSEDMKKFSADFKKRKLGAYGSYLAEYGFPFQETTYIVQLSLQPDGSYKLLRF